MLVFHLYVHFNEVSVHAFSPFSKWIVFIVEFWEVLFYILNTSFLSDMWFANIFSQSVTCLFNFFTGSFKELKIFVWWSPIYWFCFLLRILFFMSIIRTICLARSWRFLLFLKKVLHLSLQSIFVLIFVLEG